MAEVVDNPVSLSATGALEVRFEQVGHRFGRRVLYAGIDLTVGRGDVLVVAGGNGTGKSTLLRFVAGLLQPASGRVVLAREGRTLDAEGRRRAIGYMSPETLPYRPLTVRENLRFFAKVRGVAAWDEGVVERLGLIPRLDQPVAELSSGYVQRVKLAIALLHRPEVLLLDEPGVTLDDLGQEQLAEVVRRQREVGITLLAANDPRDVAYGTRIMRLGG